MCLDVLEQGGEDGQQRHGHVADALADALHLGTGLHELPQFQHLQQLLQVLRRTLEEGPKPGFDQLRARLHDRSEGREHECCACTRLHSVLDGSLCVRRATTCAYLVSSECVRMCRQLTIIAESLPVREISSVNVEKAAKRPRQHPDRGHANLTKERNPVSDKSCQLTEQAGGKKKEQKRDEQKFRTKSKQGESERAEKNKKKFGWKRD